MTVLSFEPLPPFLTPSLARACHSLEELTRALEACHGEAWVWLGEPLADTAMHALHRRFPNVRWCCVHTHPCTDEYTRTTMLESLAHAIRSPLGVLEAAIDELEHRMGDDSPEWAMLRRGLARYRRTAELLSEVAALEAKDSIRADDAPREVRLLDSVQAAWNDAQRLLPLRRELGLQIDFDSSLRVPQVIPRILGRALRELLLNARRYAEGRVAVGAERDAERWSVWVLDDGPGPGAASNPNNWARFVPPHERGAKSDLAMGLSIVRDDVDRLGGLLRIASRDDGRGTRAEIRWPIA